MAYTAQNLITDVLLDMGVIADGAAPTASQLSDALTKLNDLIDSWSIDKLSVYGATQYVMPLVSGQGSYTIGPDGDLDIPFPTNITQAFIRNNNGSGNNTVDYPIRILTNDEYASLPFKSWTGGFPFIGVWFDAGYPLITAYLNPIPTDTSYSLAFWSDNALSDLTGNTVLTFPPGYQRAIKYSLYIELAPSYQIDISQGIATLAASSKATIERKNVQINTLATRRHGHYNIISNRVYQNNG